MRLFELHHGDSTSWFATSEEALYELHHLYPQPGCWQEYFIFMLEIETDVADNWIDFMIHISNNGALHPNLRTVIQTFTPAMNEAGTENILQPDNAPAN